MIGETIKQYLILEKLGDGGMGVVYKAEDTRLQRMVAVKSLVAAFPTEDEKARFLREARAAAALDHPNICPIYEVIEGAERTLLVMAYVDGPGLKQKIASGPMQLEEALDIAVQICRGLEAAHRKFIVHRDIKPQNILLTSEGLVRIVDFGLAHMTGETRITRDGSTLGTPAYMAPEQWMGGEIDHRADLWSLGVVLYEILAGRLPFPADRLPLLSHAIINHAPRPLELSRPGLPSELIACVSKLLEKDPQNRHSSATELLADLKALQSRSPRSASPADANTLTVFVKSLQPLSKPLRLSRRNLMLAGAAPLAAATVYLGWRLMGSERFRHTAKPKSLVVLPFVNTSSDSEAEYLSDGITDELTNAFTKIALLRVVARTSAYQFKSKEQDIRQVAQQLAVDTLLTGTVRRTADRIRISVQLINASDGYQLWSEIYERPVNEVFAIQDEITRETLGKLNLSAQILTAQRPRRANPDLAAYNFYLQGRFQWNKRSEQGFRQAIELFDKAIAADPTYPQPYSGLSDAYALQGLFGASAPKDTLPMSKAAALKALELDSSLAEAHISLALVLLIYDWNFAESEREFRRGLDFSPGYATASHWYAHYLAWTGRFPEAMKEIERAQQLDPLALAVKTNMAWFWFLQRRYDTAIEQLRTVLSLDPNFSRANIYLTAAYGESGKFAQAFEILERTKEVVGPDEHLMSLARTLALAQKRPETESAVSELKQRAQRRYISPYVFAMIYSALRDREEAFVWLEKAYQERSAMLVFLKVDPRVDALRSDSRFGNLMKRMGWPS